MDRILEELGIKPFQPAPIIVAGWAQTVDSAYWPQMPEIPGAVQSIVNLHDGDQLVIMNDCPKGWIEGDRIAVLVHGITGSHKSNYMIRICRKLLAVGIKVVRVNLRGCGPGIGLAKKPYHCGQSEDLREVLLHLHKVHPQSPVTQIGFSLGANITLKMAGEDGDRPSGGLDSVIAVSPPVDIKAASLRLSHRGAKFFSKVIVGNIKKALDEHTNHHGEVHNIDFHEGMTVLHYDEMFIAPKHGFKDAYDYYEKASSGPFIPKIKVNTLILGSKDDPVVDPESFKIIPPADNLDLVLTRRGGHLGFIGKSSGKMNYRWMDDLIIAWLKRRVFDEATIRLPTQSIPSPNTAP